MREEYLVEIATEEADEVARCLAKFEQKHESCSYCRNREFCAALSRTYTSRFKGGS